MPAGYSYKCVQGVNKVIAFLEGQFGATHLGASGAAVWV